MDNLIPFSKAYGPQEHMVEPNLDGLGYVRVEHIPGSTYKDNSTAVVVPMRGTMREVNGKPVRQPLVHVKILQSWQNLIAPMNQKRAFFYSSGNEVGQSYNEMIRNILAEPQLRNWKYILTLEDDNLIPADAHIRLLESIELGPFDAVSGIYWTKGDYNMPMAYGNPDEFRSTGNLEFRPRDIRDALTKGRTMEVNGIAMGCALWRMDLFREIPEPWFVTVNDVIENKGAACGTQDLVFCEKARRMGKRFAVDMRVRVGHFDIETGVTY